MTWIKLDDNAPRHPKVSGLSDRAFRAWIGSLCYASEFLTDGHLPVAFLQAVKRAVQDELLDAGLWAVRADTSVYIHDYLGHQNSKQTVNEEKERNRRKSQSYRESTKVRTGTSTKKVPDPDTETDTETDQNKNGGPLPSRPLIAGEAHPKTWGKIHGDHVPDFCDWVCFPEFIFAEFVRKSAGPEYVRGWAARVRQDWEGKTVGDNLKFWRSRWSDAHPEAAKSTPKTRSAAEIIASIHAEKVSH